MHHQAVRKCLKKTSVKKLRPLDFDMSSMDIGTDKFFFGYKGRNGLQFTRIRTSFERLIPKLIIRLLTEENNAYYEICFGIFTFLWLILMAVFLLMALCSMFINTENIAGIPQLLIIFGIQVGAFFLEWRLTTSRVEKAIKKYAQPDVNVAQ